MSKSKDKLLEFLAVPAKIFMIALFATMVVMIIQAVSMISTSMNKPIEINKQIAYLMPLMKEVEENVKGGEIKTDLKLNHLFKQEADGTIVASAYKDGVLYLNLMKERNNYYVDDNLLVMKPSVTNNKITWNCFYVQAGKIVGEDPYSCVKTSETLQNRKRASEKIKVPLRYDLFDDRTILLKLYAHNGKEVPKELLLAIEDERKVLEKYAKKKKDI